MIKWLLFILPIYFRLQSVMFNSITWGGGNNIALSYVDKWFEHQTKWFKVANDGLELLFVRNRTNRKISMIPNKNSIEETL